MVFPSASPSSPPLLPPWLILMGALAALGPLAIDMYLPAFGAMAADLGVHPGQVERTLASYLLGLALAQLVYGPLADRYGRKPPLLLGLTLFAVASVACALSRDIDHLILWRVVQAFGGAAGMVVPRAVIRDHLDTREAAQALSLLMLVMGVMPILAPLLGGQAVTLGSWRTVFYLMGLAGVGLWLAVALYMRESLDPARRAPLAVGAIAASFRLLLTHRRFMGYTLAGGFGSGGLFAYISGSPQVFITIYGIDPRWFGLLFGLNAAALIVASQASARLLNRHPPIRLLARAQGTLVLMTLCGLALTLLDWISLPLLMLCLMGFMASQGFVGPNAAALALANQGPRLGVASALMGSLQMLCGALAGFAVSAWHTGTPLPLTAVLAACAVLSWLSGRIAMRSPRQPA
ncbi:Bcr/CflA family multidrug efflux MFS transporter [Castellaniella defragrans]|uniref:Bcr/CflA family efflux transporter n=1 Tax=Castellaniella defragrans TaxID=75697 RepID=A0A7W9TSA0_CASDE|nr:Bcr/CflA family multidrug efflux MFS transporter [Castellaniella defragrans]MBB6085048.1 DHA1 family bicyclomycin/chloramphenicol resistance-like MFS transporter [Castellaniella defragrans]